MGGSDDVLLTSGSWGTVGIETLVLDLDSGVISRGSAVYPSFGKPERVLAVDLSKAAPWLRRHLTPSRVAGAARAAPWVGGVVAVVFDWGEWMDAWKTDGWTGFAIEVGGTGVIVAAGLAAAYAVSKANLPIPPVWKGVIGVGAGLGVAFGADRLYEVVVDRR